MAVPKEITDLIDRFDRNREAYQSGKYNETQLRREFIDPFFKALGWDVDNTAQSPSPIPPTGPATTGWWRWSSRCFPFTRN